MAPGDRPPFSELCVTISKFIEHIAGYLQVGYNPFTVKEKNEEKKEGENEEESDLDRHSISKDYND